MKDSFIFASNVTSLTFGYFGKTWMGANESSVEQDVLRPSRNGLDHWRGFEQN